MDQRSTNSDKAFPSDREIQKTNAFQKDSGLPPIFTTPAYFWTTEKLVQYRTLLRHNGELKVKPAFTGRDKILLHFNNVTPHSTKPSDELLSSKYKDHISTLKFGAPYAAQAFINRIIDLTSSNVPTPSKKWVGPNRLSLNDWILISSDPQSETSLEDVMSDLSKEESKWKLPHPYDQYAQYIAFYHQGIHPQLNARSLDSAGLLSKYTDNGENLDNSRRVTKGPRHEPEVKKSKADKPKTTLRSSPDGFVSIADIANTLSITAGEARKILRSSKTPKPSSGSWSWSKAEVPNITKILKKGMK